MVRATSAEDVPMLAPHAETIPLHPNHGWRVRPGYKIFVANRGAVRFDVPQDWPISHGVRSVHFHDRTPPKDECRLEFSLFNLPPLDWSRIPLQGILESVAHGQGFPAERLAPPDETPLPAENLALCETRYLEPKTGKPARWRMCVARETRVHCLLTFSFWEADYERCDAVWRTVLETLVLGVYIADPRQGPGTA
jgi:hypothetical protein